MDNYNYYDSTTGNFVVNQAENEAALSTYVADVTRRVFVKMFLGLLVTAITSFVVLANESLVRFILGNSIVFWVLAGAELVLVFTISGAINRLSTSTATLLFYLYSVINGLTLTPIFLVYTQSSIALTFAITAGVFGVMAAYGYVTKRDLSKMGSILVMALIGLILVSLVNLFVKSSGLQWLISLAGVAIFVGLTAWDTQKIKNMASMTDPTQVGKLATMGALMLYLDFINLFLYLLRFLGNRNS